MKRNWNKFVSFALEQKRNRDELFIVSGNPYGYCSSACHDFLEPARHVRKTIVGIVRQIKRDVCMNDRKIKIYRVDLDLLSVEIVFEGRIK